MFITIADVNDGIFTLPEPINNQDGNLKIGIRSIGCWVGFYNIYEKQGCRWGRGREDGSDFVIEPGLYFFKEIARNLRKAVKNLNLVLDKTTGLIDLSIPEGISLWIPEAVKYMLGIQDEGWLQGNYVGDRPVEFLPTGGISIYLKELSTSNNVSTNGKGKLVSSNYLGNIPMLSENFGQYFSIRFDNPIFKKLNSGNIEKLEFDLKLEWGNGVQDTLNNHSMPISLELEIK